MLFFGRISPGAIISNHLKIQSLVLEKDLTIWMFIVWESLFPNHKSESWILWYLFTLYIFQKFCCLKKLQNTVSKKCFVFARYITNMKYLEAFVLDSFYNLVVSFGQGATTKIFCHAYQILAFKRLWGWGFEWIH